jgi:hypothetical protein
MTALDELLPAPHLVELHQATIAAPADLVWRAVRHRALAQSWPIRLLFGVRNLLVRDGDVASPFIRIDDLTSTPQRPGFQMLVDRPPHEFVVGAIGKVWKLRIPFVYVASASEYAAFSNEGFIKVAWGLRIRSLAEPDRCRATVEVRVVATDHSSWRKFRLYFLLIGPFSRYIRRSLLRTVARDAARSRWARAEEGWTPCPASPSSTRPLRDTPATSQSR